MGFKFPRASDTVQEERSFDLPPLSGILRSYSRGDHTHGTPAFLVHSNEFHDPRYIHTYLFGGAVYVATDISVGSSAPVTIATFSRSPTYYEWVMPIGGLNYRTDPANTADRTLRVWYESPLGTIRSAQFPLIVKLAEVKHPFTYPPACRDIVDLIFWTTPKTAAYSIYLRAQTDAEAAIVSDRYITYTITCRD